MHQICDGYNPKVKMGNWQEESYSVPQEYRTNPQKKCRQAEIDIGYIDAHLKLRPLNRTSRMPPWNTSGLVQAPQFQGLSSKTNCKQNYDVSTVGHYFTSWKPHLYEKGNGSNLPDSSYLKINKFRKQYKMFDQQKIAELLQERVSDCSSFRSQLRPNTHVNEKDLLETIYQSNISQTGKHIMDSTMKLQGESKRSEPELIQPSFRRIRSQITLKGIPPFRTNK